MVQLSPAISGLAKWFRAPGPDRPRVSAWQVAAEGGAQIGEGRMWDWAQARRGLRLRTLVLLRWVAIFGQLAAILCARFGLGFQFPWVWCLAIVALSAWANLSVMLALPGPRLAGDRQAVLQLGFDIVVLGLLLALTGGLQNPFALLLIAPATVAAATLQPRHAVALTVLALAAIGVLQLFALPLPSAPLPPAELSRLYALSQLLAVVVGVVFTAGYAWQASAEASRMELALAATQAVLAREQRLSALGGLAAAAAHELGTPLATIQVVTKEMARTLEPGTDLAEDVALLAQQAQRCRDILRKLSRAPDQSDLHHSRMSLSQLLDEVAEPHRGGEIVVDTDVTCAPGAAILEIKRLPEVLHALTAFVENATDFAESSVEVLARYDDERLFIEVRDDGPGFPPEVMSRLGQPYITTRSQGENSRSNHHGMGLGFFISKTLLERTGATVEFRNARRGGAVITTRWPRARIEAPAGT